MAIAYFMTIQYVSSIRKLYCMSKNILSHEYSCLKTEISQF